MKQPPVIIIINKKPYTVSTTDIETIRNIPSADRQQLITLLELIKRVETQSQSVIQQVSTHASTLSQAVAAYPESGNVSVHQYMNVERLGSGDVDALMAQLIMEEKRHQKPALTKQSIQKWAVIIASLVLLLVLLL